jgi:hypothetical protein
MVSGPQNLLMRRSEEGRELHCHSYLGSPVTPARMISHMPNQRVSSPHYTEQKAETREEKQ